MYIVNETIYTRIHVIQIQQVFLEMAYLASVRKYITYGLYRALESYLAGPRPTGKDRDFA